MHNLKEGIITETIAIIFATRMHIGEGCIITKTDKIICLQQETTLKQGIL
jgi:hypothetical protein